MRTVYKINIGVNKLTFLPYYLSFGQLMVNLVYLAVYLSMDAKDGYFVLLWKSTFVKFSNICLDGILLTLALTMNLITALIRFQVRVGLEQAEVRRDEHFAQELKIKRCYIGFFCFILFFKATALIQDCIYPSECSTFCQINWVIIVIKNILLLLIYCISGFLLFYYSKRHRYFVYRKNRNIYILQAIFILLGISCSIGYSIGVQD